MSFGGYLQANTAVDVLIGPFVDDTDGKTAETGLTITVDVSKNGQALAAKNDATAPTHDAAGTVDGYYNCELDTTDTNTEGTLTLACSASGALPRRHDFLVISQAAYASIVTAKDSGFMDVNLDTIKTQTVTCSAGVTVLASVGTSATSTAQTGDSYAIVNGDHGLVSIQDDIDAILADTGELQTDLVNGGRLDLLIDAIKTKTDSLTYTVAGQVDANIQAVNDVALVGNGSTTAWGPA